MGTPPLETASNTTGLSFSTTLSIGPVGVAVKQVEEDNPRKVNCSHESEDMNYGHGDSLSPKHNQLSLQLDLFPHTPAVLPRTSKSNLPLPFTWPPSTENGEEEEGEEGPAASSSPNNSAASSLQMDLCIYSKGLEQYGKRGSSGEGCDQRASSRASDEDDNNSVGRKKLRLSKQQSAFLEERFKENSTLNPKQKVALAKQLGLRPRQVEVWFQNRRARTKLKQTEVDCEYLKRCCETLTEENRRLHKELQELRALKTSNPFDMQLPATTLTMCPSCERVATNSTSAASSNTPASTTAHSNGRSSTIASKNKTNDPIFNSSIVFPINRPKFNPFAHS